MRSIARVNDGEAGNVVGHFEEAAAGVLAGVDALEAGFDAGDALFAHGVDGRGLSVRLGVEPLPVGDLLGNPVPEERGQVRQGRT